MFQVQRLLRTLNNALPLDEPLPDEERTQLKNAFYLYRQSTAEDVTLEEVLVVCHG